MNVAGKYHECRGSVRSKGGYGAAITTCSRGQEGYMEVDNGEYSSIVAFCPYCGKAARNLPPNWHGKVTYG